MSTSSATNAPSNTIVPAVPKAPQPKAKVSKVNSGSRDDGICKSEEDRREKIESAVKQAIGKSLDVSTDASARLVKGGLKEIPGGEIVVTLLDDVIDDSFKMVNKEIHRRGDGRIDSSAEKTAESLNASIAAGGIREELVDESLKLLSSKKKEVGK